MYSSDKPFDARKFTIFIFALFLIGAILQTISNRVEARMNEDDAKAKVNRSRVEKSA